MGAVRAKRGEVVVEEACANHINTGQHSFPTKCVRIHGGLKERSSLMIFESLKI